MKVRLTLYFLNNSFDNGELIRTLLSTEVAPKCAFLIFLREDVLFGLSFPTTKEDDILIHIL